MDDKLTTAQKILSKYNQEHLLSFYDEIDDIQKDMLLDKILSINFDQITSLYTNSYIEPDTEGSIITPLPYMQKSQLTPEEISYFNQLGIDAIKRGEFAVVTLSGGDRN